MQTVIVHLKGNLSSGQETPDLGIQQLYTGCIGDLQKGAHCLGCEV